MVKPKPVYGTDGIPYCVSCECPAHDGKRCSLLGHAPSDICNVIVHEMVVKLADIHTTRAELTSEEAMREQMFKTMQALECAAQAFLTRDVSVSDTPMTCFQCGSTRCGRLPSSADQTPKPIPTGPTQATGDKLARAIALLTLKVFSPNEKLDHVSDHQIYRLLGVRACELCRGSGWIERDESCEACGSSGFLNP